MFKIKVFLGHVFSICFCMCTRIVKLRNKFFQIEFLCIFSGDRIFSVVYFYNFLLSMIYHMLDGIQIKSDRFSYIGMLG